MQKNIIILTCCIVAVLSSCKKVFPEAGAPIPEFSITTNEGQNISEKDFLLGEGMIVFFNTSCNDCRKELPMVEKYHNEHPEVLIVAIAREETKESIQPFWEQNGLSFPFSEQNDRKIYNLFTNKGIPLIIHTYNGVITDKRIEIKK